MIFSKKFHTFSYQKFSDFIYDLLDHHGYWGIRFNVADQENAFSEHQLTHATAGRDIGDERGFIGAWQQKPSIRIVNFSFLTRDERSSIRMTINLDNKTITLDEAVNASPDLILSILQRHFVFTDNRNLTGSNKWWERSWVQIIFLLGAVAGIVGLFTLFG